MLHVDINKVHAYTGQENATIERGGGGKRTGFTTKNQFKKGI